MMIYRAALAALAFTSALTQAQAHDAQRRPPPLNIAAVLKLDATRAQVVEAILENSHGRVLAAREQIGRPTDETTHAVLHAAMHAIRIDTRKQLASVLTAEELARLEEFTLPPGPPERAHPRPQNSSL